MSGFCGTVLNDDLRHMGKASSGQDYNSNPLSLQCSHVNSIFLPWVMLVNSCTSCKDPFERIRGVQAFCTWTNLSPDSCLPGSTGSGSCFLSYLVPTPTCPRAQGSTLLLVPLGFAPQLLSFTGSCLLLSPTWLASFSSSRRPLPTTLLWTSRCRTPFPVGM